MKNKKFFLFLAALPFLAFVPGPEDEANKYAATITADDLGRHLNILASDEYEGRETGKKGQKMAAEYISARFKEMGIPALPTGSYYQPIDLFEKQPGAGTITSNKKEFRFSSDFFYISGIDDIKRKLPSVVFAGYGMSEANYDDYAGIDVKDKVVMILPGEPHDKKGRSLITGKPGDSEKSDRRQKVNLAREKGAAAVFIVLSNYATQLQSMKHSIEATTLRLNLKTEEKTQAPFFFISFGMADALLANAGSVETVNMLTAHIRKKKKPKSIELKQEILIDVQRVEKQISSENVLGFIEGSDLKEEIIVVTAHYDHIGKEGDVVYNGADDDGSGTVAIMEMAEAFAQAKKDGRGPRRSMLFMAVSGEEKGLLGSRWYTENPVFPLEKTVCDLNIDMIGRIDTFHVKNKNYVYIIGSDKLSTELHQINEAANKKYMQLELDYKYNSDKDPNRFYYRSDHYNFAKKNIPIIFYFNGTHKDYHKETDEVKKIDFPLMEKRTRLVFYTAWELANRDKRIVVDKKPN
ncbi:MAG: putative aminopeptidase [Bacteroidetes bacterium]|nr:MAG: putative aminopeptidase [Bacteroidota bacterium]